MVVERARLAQDKRTARVARMSGAFLGTWGGLMVGFWIDLMSFGIKSFLNVLLNVENWLAE